jgi:hypothetical protein
MRRTCVIQSALVLAGWCVLAVSATAQKVQVEADRDERTDFAAIRTYSWLPSPPLKTETSPDGVSDPTISHEVLRPHIVSAIDRELTSRGLKKVDRGTSDVNVVYYAALSVGVTAQQLGSYYQYTTGWAMPLGPMPTSSVQVFERGSIIVDVVSRRGNKAVWRGSVASNLNRENTLEKRIARIEDAIPRVFERYPVRPVRKR